MRLHAFAAAALIAAGSAQAATTGFVANPTANSTDWTQYVTSLGSPIDLDVDFETHPLGALQGNHYQATDGVTMTLGGSNFSFNAVYTYFNNYTGSVDGSLSAAEGLTAENQRVYSAYSTTGAWTLTFDFDAPVLGFGLDVIDLYNPWGDRTVTIAAYDGAGGTGNLLGSFSALQRNFQLYNKYFMGLASDAAEIRSVVFTNPYPYYGDGIALDNVRVALAPNPVPEPETWALMAGGLALLALARRRRG